MSKFMKTIAGSIVSGLMLAASSATASNVLPYLPVYDTTVLGTIMEHPQRSTSVNYWRFNVSSPNTVTIDVASFGVRLGNGYGGVSRLDSHMRLFDYDANGSQGFLGAQVAENDDYFGVSVDGSISTLDSFLSVSLERGSYILAISDWYLSEAEARSGVNRGSFSGTYGNYELSFTGVDLAPVPLPAALPLLTVALGGLGVAARRRRKA